MRKFFSILGLITIMIGSYSYSSFSVSVLKELDDIMISLNDIKNEYKIDSVDAIIDGNSIIPGIKGREIDIDASYKNMKEINKFNSSLIVYKDVKPNISVEDNKDKYISNGNRKKSSVSIILKVDNMDELTSINNFKFDYTFDNKKTKVFNFCLYNDLKYLNECANNNLYTIKPIIINKRPLKRTKEVISNGSILMYEVTNEFLKEYEIILKYIVSKGYNIVYINELVKE